METLLTTILVLLFLAIGIGALVLGAVFHDYEHEREKCGNCVYRDDTLHYCWARTQETGTEEKACPMFKKREES